VPALLYIPWFKLTGITLVKFSPETMERYDTLRSMFPQGEIAIQPFGILVALGVILGARMSERRAQRLGLKREIVSDAILYIVGIGFLLGHPFDMIFYEPEKVAADPIQLLFFWTSLSSFGGFFGAVVGGFIWRWHRGYPLTPALDQVAYGLPLGWLFGRTGCFIVHDHPGRVTDFFLAVDNFTYNGVTGPRHDLGLYEVFWCLLVIPLFMWLDKKPRPHGFFIAWIALLYAPVRFGLDFLREADATYGGFTPGHYSAFVTLALGLFMLWRIKNHPVTVPRGMLADAPDTTPKATESAKPPAKPAKG
jgi:phosphatidylglycerol:prolipoprotein diacylglycerol transferase